MASDDLSRNLESPRTDRGLADVISTLSSVNRSSRSAVLFVGKPQLRYSPLLIDALVDLTGCINIGSRPYAIRATALLQNVREALIQAGWSSSDLLSDYRGNVKQTYRPDIAIVGQDGSLVLAVEVKLVSRSELEDASERLAQIVGADWMCSTNGEDYILLDAKTKSMRYLRNAPTPFDVDQSGVMPLSRPSDIRQPFRPSSVDELHGYLEKLDIKQLILDTSLPIALRLNSSDQMRWLRFANVSLNSTLEPATLLMLWGGALPFIETVSAIMRRGVLFGDDNIDWRRMIADICKPIAIVDLPPGALDFSSIPATLLLLKKGEHPTYFDSVQLASDLINPLEEPWGRSLVGWLRYRQPGDGYAIDELDEKSWSPTAYHPDIHRIMERLVALGPVSHLEEICNIFPGIAQTSTVATLSNESLTKLLEPSSIGPNGIDLTKARYVRSVVFPEHMHLRQGDVLLKAMPTLSASAAVFDSLESAIPSKSLYVLRLKDSSFSATGLAVFLNSTLGQRLISSRVTGNIIQRISVRAVRSLPIPRFRDGVLEDLQALQRIESAIRAKADELESKRRAAFESEDREQFEKRVAEVKRLGTLMTSGLLSTDQLSYQVRNFFPFPLAYSYRLLDSIVNASDLYREQMRAAENILAFLGALCMSLLQREDRTASTIDAAKWWGQGVSPGHWREMIGACSKLFGSYVDSPLHSEIASLKVMEEKRGFGKLMHALIRAKNDFKHDRGPSPGNEMEQAVMDVGTLLSDVMSDLKFLTQYPLRLVRDMDYREDTGEMELKCLRYMGDHPGFLQESIARARPVPKGKLFVEVEPNVRYETSPFITVLNCATCRQPETYFIDTWDRSAGKARLRSFERGHTVESREIATELAGWAVRA